MNESKILVQVRIRRDTKYGELNDAFYVEPSEFFDENGKQKLTDDDIDAFAQSRVANYERVIDEANRRVPDPPPTEDEEFGSLPAEYVARLASWVAKTKPELVVLDSPVDAIVKPGGI